MDTIKFLDKLAITLLIVGGLNWGLVGLFSIDLIAKLFGGSDTILSQVVYTLVGLSAVYTLVNFKKCCKK